MIEARPHDLIGRPVKLHLQNSKKKKSYQADAGAWCTMAKSKHRKKQVVENKKHLEKVKKRYRNQNTSINRSRRKSEENDKENLDQSNCEVVAPESPSPAAAREASNEVQQASYTYEEGSGWLTGLYGWCQTGITQVSIL